MKKYIINLFLFIVLFKTNLSFAETPSFINYIISKTNSPLYVVNKYGEFIDENGFKQRISKYSCYIINNSNYTLYNQKGYILNIDTDYCYTKEINSEKKIYYKDVSKYYKTLNFDLPLSLENNNYYIYKFTDYHIFQDPEGFYKSDFDRLGYKADKIIILKKGSKYVIVKDFQKIKLFDKSLISNIKNKVKFMQIVYDDIKKSDTNEQDVEKYLKQMKYIGEKLRKIDYDSRIKIIYKYLIDKTTYYTGSLDGNLDGNSIFSGIYTYKTGVGVCDGYVKQMAYLLMFAGVEDITIKRGFVINSLLFPEVGHTWIKIGDYYYDPTFEDPIDQKGIKKESSYKYFKLPQDLIYADRFDADTKEDIPNEYIFLDKKQRDNLVEKNFYKIASNPIYSNYLLLAPYVHKLKLGLGYDEKLTLEKAKNILSYIEVFNNRGVIFFYDSKGTKKYIKSLIYYKVDNNNIDDVIKNTFSYNTEGLILIKRINTDGTSEYRLTKNINFY